MTPTPWTWFGPRRVRPRGNLPGIVLALMMAWPAMSDVEPRYPLHMVVLALGGAAWFLWLGVRARALVSLLLLPVASIWLNPLFGATWFTVQGPAHFLPHAALALLLGVAAYTYAATERDA